MKFNTKLIHSAFYNPLEHNGAIMPPIYQNSSFKMNDIYDIKGYRYSRLSNPTRKVLEDNITDLENGNRGFAFSSGIAAIDSVFRSFLLPGDNILVFQDIYGGTYDLLTQFYAKLWNINIIFADLTNLENLLEIVKNNKIKMIWLETPSNPLLKILDIKAISSIAKENNSIVGIDNTFATPYLQKPLDLGADIVIHSATKYLAGHSDVTLGLVVTKEDKFSNPIYLTLVNAGANAAPFDCSLTLRGIKTLAVRMDRHLENAQYIAEKLKTIDELNVIYPGFSNHQGHQIAQKQMNGYGSVISIDFKENSLERVNAFIKNLKIFTLSPSLGGVESMINHSYSQSHCGLSENLKNKLGINKGLIRLSIGIEDKEDIWHDLINSFNKYKKKL